ncbi:MAG: hypothetical protein IT582_05065 [Opitutaceae bacterium]|nr:hypothetical protein [Opitutaceae bacterium]
MPCNLPIAAVAKNPNDTNLRTLSQLGVAHYCFYGTSSDTVLKPHCAISY